MLTHTHKAREGVQKVIAERGEGEEGGEGKRKKEEGQRKRKKESTQFAPRNLPLKGTWGTE